MKAVSWCEPEATLPYGDTEIRYTVRRTPGRTSARVAIHIEPDGYVLVDAAENAPWRQIRAAIGARASWIQKHLTEIRRRRAHVLPREYVSGESWPYLGRRYRLKVVVHSKSIAEVRLRGSYLEVSVASRNRESVRVALNDWYRAKAKAVLEERLGAIARSLRWMPKVPAHSVRAMTVQWGCCSPSGRLTLNPHLVKAPRECIDYVVMHELCHIRFHNHGREFYKLLERHIPDWRRIKTRLDEQAETILNT